MNCKQKKAFKKLVTELQDVVPQKDWPKLQRLERLVGELRRERGMLLAKLEQIEAQRISGRAEAAKADSEQRKRITSLRKEFSEATLVLKAQIREQDELIATLTQRTSTLQSGLYPIEIDWLYLTKEQLIRANAESIRLGFNRNLKEDYVVSLPDQHYLIGKAFYHVGFSGREFQQLNYRLLITLCRKLASPFLTGEDMEHGLLDVSAEMWDELRQQAGLADAN